MNKPSGNFQLFTTRPSAVMLHLLARRGLAVARLHRAIAHSAAASRSDHRQPDSPSQGPPCLGPAASGGGHKFGRDSALPFSPSLSAPKGAHATSAHCEPPPRAPRPNKNPATQPALACQTASGPGSAALL